MFKSIVLPVALLGAFVSVQADEGQWQPHQLPQLASELTRIGIAIPAQKLADLQQHPMSAIVSLGGCSASFVSNAGLIVTNHHCAYSAIQRNATPQHNYIADGFLASKKTEELPGGPNSRVYLTDQVDNVTARVLAGLDGKFAAAISATERHATVERRIKKLIAECERDPAYRCAVPAFHRGLEYYRIRQLMIRDVRLVYAPSDRIGNYGGDVDNYEWPRHTGDFAFLRAYVGKDGRPADPSPDNVPYQSKDFLVVSSAGLKSGDPVLLAGYPGRTSRYRLPAEIRHAQQQDYPLRAHALQADLDATAGATAGDAAAELRYASVVKSLNNVLKKTRGLQDGFARSDIAAIKDGQHAQLRAWLAGQPKVAPGLLSELDAAIASDIALSGQEFGWSQALNSDLLKSARTLYRLALERKKPDAERESGYQQRDVAFIKARLQRLEQSLLPAVDEARFGAGLQGYRQLAVALHPPGLDALLPDMASLPALYLGSGLADAGQRLAWLERDRAAFHASDDAFVQLAIKLNGVALKLEERRKEVDGKLERIIPQYMQAVIAWKQSQGKPVYPDANSTLRVSFGTVASYAPQDGLVKGPFTTVQGITAKHTGKEPFNAPEAVLDAVKQQRYGQFRDAVLGTVPVNFLSTLDTTGGNSGSAVMNGNGELVGLNFDSTYESITKDWYFDTAITRAIHVEIRYMLWVMQEIDHADNLLQEMTIRYPQ